MSDPKSLHRQREPSWRLIPGDCIEVMATLPDCSVDSIVCDPPYGLGFMGKEWDTDFAPGDTPMRRSAALDSVNAGASRQGGRQRAGADYQKRQARDARSYQEWCESWAKEALRVLKPGGYILACGGTRTYHRLTCGIEDAGFEVRDEVLSVFEATEVGREFLAMLTPEQLGTLDKMGGGPLAWLYGSGFPKSLDVSKAIDKAAGADRIVIGERVSAYGTDTATGERVSRDGGGAGLWGGGDAKAVPLTGAPATPDAERWDGWGTALKPAHEPICVARKSLAGTVAANVLAHGTGAINVDGCRIGHDDDLSRYERSATSGYKKGGVYGEGEPTVTPANPAGRWPANVVLDEAAAAMLDEQTGELTSGKMQPTHTTAGVDGRGVYGADAAGGFTTIETYGDTGGASRFLYVAKPDQVERNVGLHGQRNPHPTVKPMDLMRWLCRLVTPPGGTVLDPFSGSGTTGIAALREGFSFIGIEREAEYVDLARARIVGDAPLINSVLEEAA